MKAHIIDFRKTLNINEAHKEIKNSLKLNDYYGENLDALNDCLTEMPIDDFFYILVCNNKFDGFENIIRVFDDNNIKYVVMRDSK